MHVLADRYRSEFLACPQLVRFDFAEGADSQEPTLLIKAGSLLLKYVTLGVGMQLIVARVGGERLLYAVKIVDDPDQPATLWSVLEHEGEKAALHALANGDKCQIFLFNELAVCAAWAEVSLDVPSQLSALAEAARVGPADHQAVAAEASSIFSNLHSGRAAPSDVVTIDIPPVHAWRTMDNTYITNRLSRSRLNLLDNDEGGQQEQLVIWLTDSLQPSGAIYSPQIPKGAGTRELTDILLSYDFGCVLFESKALAVLSRATLPNRAKLIRGIASNAATAASQLKGAVRKIRAGVPVTDLAGSPVDLERLAPPHAIILVPDLQLLAGDPQFGTAFIRDFVKASGAIPHILDPAELLRVVQAAQMIAERDSTATLMMAFDAYLTRRAERAIQEGNLCLSILLRFEPADA